MRPAILHIGTEKTGTTALQAALAHNRARLADHGFVYPGAEMAHHSLVNALVPPELATQVLSEPEKKAYLSGLAAEIGAAPADARLIFSSELCHFRLDSVEAAHRLLLTLEGVGAGVRRIIVYFRDQCSLVESSWAEGLKAGRLWDHEEQITVFRRYFSHKQTADRWREAAGRLEQPPALSIQSYFRHGHGLITHFLRTVGVGAATELDTQQTANIRSSRAVLEAVRRANELGVDLPPDLFHAFLAALDPRPPEPFLSPDWRRRITDEFADENAAMCADHGLHPADFPACAPVAGVDEQPLQIDDLIRMLGKAYRRTLPT